MEKSTNLKINSINYLRIICAVLVVAIHTRPFYDVNATLGFISTEVLTRIAVPFFFMVSGYFFKISIEASDKSFSYLKKYLLRLLITYTIWSAFYFCINLINAIKGNYFTVKSFIADCLTRFLFFGAYYHLWFYPALIFAVIITFIFLKIKKFNLLFIFLFFFICLVY